LPFFNEDVEVAANRAIKLRWSGRMCLAVGARLLLSEYFYSLLFVVDITPAILTPLEDG
jgi:hypothetical protein